MPITFAYCHCSLHLQINFDSHLKTVSEMTEIGETVQRVDALILETKKFQKICDADIERADEVVAIGEKLLITIIWDTR